jgi:hypothetical protein
LLLMMPSTTSLGMKGLVTQSNPVPCSISNDNFANRPISRYISQMSGRSPADEPEEVDAAVVGRARVALGGGADLGAGQVLATGQHISFRPFVTGAGEGPR